MIKILFIPATATVTKGLRDTSRHALNAAGKKAN